MSLSDLPASELARIDSICLDFESKYRRGESPDIDGIVRDQGGSHSELLRQELELVRAELEASPGKHLDSSSHSTSVGAGQTADISLPRPGTTVGPYVVGELLGRGGMGVVFAARDQRLGRTVAIKMLATEIARREDLNERFQREARAVAALSHPNIVELFDVGEVDGLPYAVMEYLDGELLDRRLSKARVSVAEVRRIGAQIADALATAHASDVVHRDLKPHNVMLVQRRGGPDASPNDSEVSPDGSSTIVKLFDFGLSRLPASEFELDANRSREGMILGTPGYMAPEQAKGETVTPSADIFSLGCILHEAFYGELAFDGHNKAARLASTIDQEPTIDPVRRRDDVELATLISQCLEKNPSARPTSAAQIARQLRSSGTTDPIIQQIRSGYAAGQTTRRRMLAAGGIGLVGAIAGGTWWSLNQSNELNRIRSLAVLSFTDQGNDKVLGGTTTAPPPLGDRKLPRGEQLSALLVHELSRMSQVTVPRFRPVTAETPSEFRALGKSLEVDALLTGTILELSTTDSGLMELDLQIISSDTGNEIWGQKVQTQSGDNLLEQSRLATEIAAVVGERLTSTAALSAPPSIESFRCLVDGKTRSDPDSLNGLQMALKCFQKAHDVDRRFADPIAGIALTSITLAAQTSSKESLELILQARERSDEALKLDPASIDARLAVAMLDWQTVGRYAQAERIFQELVKVAPNDWQVHHQYGLLQLTLGQIDKASRSLREAALLNPMSVIVKIDQARAAWFRGDVDRAIDDTIRIRDRYQANPLARGLLVDIYEAETRFAEAAAEHDAFNLPTNATAEQYFSSRREYLSSLQYGPFGDRANLAILQGRSEGGISDSVLAELTDPMPPMLPLLLAAHPSFAEARKLKRAQEILPNTRDSQR